MTSLVGNTASPIKEGTSSLPRRQSSLARPPLRALYDLLVAPMEGVSPTRPPGCWAVKIITCCLLSTPHPSDTKQGPEIAGGFPGQGASPSSFSVSVWRLKWTRVLSWSLVSG